MNRAAVQDATLSTLRIAGKTAVSILLDAGVQPSTDAIKADLNRRGIKRKVRPPQDILSPGLFEVEFQIDQFIRRKVYNPSLRTALGYVLAMVIAEEAGLTKHYFPIDVPGEPDEWEPPDEDLAPLAIQHPGAAVAIEDIPF